MKCRHCASTLTAVIETRRSGGLTYRMRQCKICMKRFVTSEHYADADMRTLPRDPRPRRSAEPSKPIKPDASSGLALVQVWHPGGTGVAQSKAWPVANVAASATSRPPAKV